MTSGDRPEGREGCACGHTCEHGPHENDLDHAPEGRGPGWDEARENVLVMAITAICDEVFPYVQFNAALDRFAAAVRAQITEEAFNDGYAQGYAAGDVAGRSLNIPPTASGPGSVRSRQSGKTGASADIPKEPNE